MASIEGFFFIRIGISEAVSILLNIYSLVHPSLKLMVTNVNQQNNFVSLDGSLKYKRQLISQNSSLSII